VYHNVVVNKEKRMGQTRRNNVSTRIFNEDKAVIDDYSKKAGITIAEAIHHIVADKLPQLTPAAPTKPLTVTQMTEGLISHLRECNDPTCRRQVLNRLVSSGVLPEKPVTPGVDPGAARIVAAREATAARNKPPVASVEPSPVSQSQITPWDACNISEGKYRRNTNYYNGVLREMGYDI
jgi:hypothetical protein